ncbi:MAG TPA: orotidine-5'-phosphate decarboxylase [Bacteroidales bacterium]|nr:orotidine-5'-phosphate decarboxylase [Bacteroidales bacterium]
MNSKQLFENIKNKKSFLCVGLDSDYKKIPQHLKEKDDPVFEFNKAIVDATAPYTVAYKPNLAFYESLGPNGLIALEKSLKYIRNNHPDLFVIADAKRGDIGNTSALYARAFFEKMDFDAVTVAPYMGEDSVSPFLGYDDKWVILLALTSNKGADDFQYHTEENEKLFEKVLKTSQQWGSSDNMMYVVGATRAEMLADIRKIVPEHFLLVPGVGAQGGSLAAVAEHGMNDQCGLLVNSSRGIIFASAEEDFADKAGEKAQALQKEMQGLLEKANLI